MVLNGMIVAIVENVHVDFLVVRGSSGDWKLMVDGFWESWDSLWLRVVVAGWSSN